MTTEEYVQDVLALLQRGVEALEMIARYLVAMEAYRAGESTALAGVLRGGKEREA